MLACLLPSTRGLWELVSERIKSQVKYVCGSVLKCSIDLDSRSSTWSIPRPHFVAGVSSSCPLHTGVAPAIPSPVVCALPHPTGVLLGSAYPAEPTQAQLSPRSRYPLLSWLRRHHPLLIFLLFLWLLLLCLLCWLLLLNVQMYTFLSDGAVPSCILSPDQCFTQVRWHPNTPGRLLTMQAPEPHPQRSILVAWRPRNLHVQLASRGIPMQVVHGTRFDEVLHCTTACVIHSIPRHRTVFIC